MVLCTALLGPALPSLASADGSTVVAPVVHAVSIPLGETAAALADGDRLVGVTWASGAPSVQARWLTAGGWTAWEVPEDDSDVPEPAERARTRGGTEPLWRPAGATLVEVRVSGEGRDLRLVRVGDGVAQRRWSFGAAPASADGSRLLPGVRSRAAWGADESLRRGEPDVAPAVKAVVVHHTAGSNDYRPADVPRRIRADYAYHVQARGWSDLGYNLVVDRFGGIWEGRAGGIGRATIGSHAAGFNTGTLGVSLLGDLTKAQPTAEAVQAVARVAAYAADVWRFDPAGSVVLTSGGSPKFAPGTRVPLPRVHGHRDVGLTACPGTLYDRLGEVRRGAAALVGSRSRISSVQVDGTPVRAPRPLVVSAPLTRAAPWAVEVRDDSGALAARAVGDGGTARLEWNGLRALVDGTPGVLPALPGPYTWTVRVGDAAYPSDVRTGAVSVAAPVLGG